jgi:hypothetical protein
MSLWILIPSNGGLIPSKKKEKEEEEEEDKEFWKDGITSQ